MGLFDIFSNSDAQNAAQAQIQGYQTGFGALNNANNQAIGSLQQNYGQGTGALQSGALGAAGAVNQFTPQATGAVAGYGAQGLAPVQANINTAQQGTTALGNALGLNGPQGNAAATQAFLNNPGYQFQVNQATQAVDRNQAATGMLASGNTNVDLANYISGLAGQGWQSYLGQLSPYLGAANTAAGQYLGGSQNIGNTLSGIYQGAGNTLAGISTGLGQGLNASYQGLGQGVAGVQQNTGNAAYGSAVGQGNAQAQADYANLQQSANLWNMFGNAVGGATKLAGSSPNLFSNIGSNFNTFGNWINPPQSA